MQQELTHLLGDRTVDLRTPKNSVVTFAIEARAEVLNPIKR